MRPNHLGGEVFAQELVRLRIVCKQGEIRNVSLVSRTNAAEFAQCHPLR